MLSRNIKTKLFLLTLLGFLFSSCNPGKLPQIVQEETKEKSTGQNSKSIDSTDAGILTLTIIYTNDEHGWIEGEEIGQGAAEITDLWAKKFKESDEVLILSGGDNWVGPAISTWFKGEGMVQVMNQMGYSASAVGNHEFDFGVDTLKERINQAQFPYLAANIRYKNNNSIPKDLGIQPYSIFEAGKVTIGLVGLANADTPSVTHPENIASLDFLDYAETLRDIVPEVWSHDVDLIFVLSHLCTWELAPLARDVKDLGITFFGGGHCHEEYAKVIEGSVILSSGNNFRSYSYVTFDIDFVNNSIIDVEYGIEENENGDPDPQIAAIVSRWREKTASELDIPIGYTEAEIIQKSEEMAALTTESWLKAYPSDVALTNWGGMRDTIRKGEITISDIVSIMPFENVLIEVELSGSQLLRVLRFGGIIPPVGGVHYKNGRWVFDQTGEAIDPAGLYSLLTTDFLYAGGDDYSMLAEYDPDAYNTAISWRQPVIDWIIDQNSNPDKPLFTLIERYLMSR